MDYRYLPTAARLAINRIASFSEKEKTLIHRALDALFTGSSNFHEDTVDPTVNDDEEFYALGTIWLNTTDDGVFILVDGTDGAAIWFELGQGGIQNIVEDLTPQLGGTLDANLFNIDMGVNTITDPKVGQWDTAFSWGDHALAGYLTSALQNVVEDTTPQLGGNLDVNGNSIVSVSGGNITITPDGAGAIVLDGLNWPTADGTADYVLKTDGAGNLSWTAQTGGGGGLNNIVEDTTPQLGGPLDVNGNSITSVSNGDINITPNGAGSVVLDGLSWPQADGTADYVLKTNGAGQLSWTAQTGGSGEANTASNVGAGTGTIYKQKTGVDLELKTLVAGTGVTITNNASDIQIDATGAGGGEVNTASNRVADDADTKGVFYQKNGVDLEFKAITAGTGMSISSDTNEVTLTCTVTDTNTDAFIDLTDTPANYTSSAGKYVESTGSGLQFTTLATVAETGSYNDLTDTPTGGDHTFSTSAPSGGSDGDIWFRYVA
jgi:hypothetical protein